MKTRRAWCFPVTFAVAMVFSSSAPAAKRKRESGYRGSTETIHLVLKSLQGEKKGVTRAGIYKDAKVTLTTLMKYLPGLQAADIVFEDPLSHGQARYKLTDKGRKILELLDELDGIISHEELRRVGKGD